MIKLLASLQEEGIYSTLIKQLFKISILIKYRSNFNWNNEFRVHFAYDCVLTE